MRRFLVSWIPLHTAAASGFLRTRNALQELVRLEPLRRVSALLAEVSRAGCVLPEPDSRVPGMHAMAMTKQAEGQAAEA